MLALHLWACSVRLCPLAVILRRCCVFLLSCFLPRHWKAKTFNIAVNARCYVSNINARISLASVKSNVRTHLVGQFFLSYTQEWGTVQEMVFLVLFGFMAHRLLEPPCAKRKDL